MADQKVTELSTLASPASEDLILVVDNPNGTPASKSLTLKNLFGAVPSNTVLMRTTVNANTTLNGSNTVISANLNSTGVATFNQLNVSNNQIRISTRNTPGSNAATGTQGSIRYDTDYIYVCVVNNVWKRSTLSQF